MLIDAGIDAISFTFPESHPDRVFLCQLATNVIDVLKAEGNDVSNPKPSGFEGVACGGAFVGVRAGIYLVQITGGHAHGVTDAITRNNIRVKYTRADFAVTYHQPAPVSIYAAGIRRQVRRHLRETRSAIPAHQALFEGPGGGSTYYLSTGDKSTVHRIYNKSAQSPGLYPERSWRSEHQVRHDRAIGAMNMAQESGDLRRFSVGVNIGFLSRYGIKEPWFNEGTPERCPRVTHKSDTARRLEWCINSAVPALMKLGDAGVDLRTVLAPLVEAGHIAIV